MIHIWHEDSSSGATTQFWEFICKHKISDEEYEVRGFDGNREFVRCLEAIYYNTTGNLYDDRIELKDLGDRIYRFKSGIIENDMYYIFIDMVYGSAAYASYDRASKIVDEFNNVNMVELLSFEYMLLSAGIWDSWLKPATDKGDKKYKELSKIRDTVINIVELESDWKDNSDLVACFNRLDCKYSIEKVVTYVASHIFSYNELGFKITKSKLGKCWTCPCCDYFTSNKIDKNSKCVLYSRRLTDNDKASILYDSTIAKDILSCYCKNFNSNGISSSRMSRLKIRVARLSSVPRLKIRADNSGSMPRLKISAVLYIERTDK